MNSIQSESNVIQTSQMRELIDGADFAWRFDMPLTRSITFNLKHEGVRPQEFISAFTKIAGDWLAIRSVPRAYEWVLECPRSPNFHLLFHVPECFRDAFARKERPWLKQIGVKWRKGILQSQKVGIMPGKKNRKLSEAEYLVNLERALEYMMKGGNKKACDRLGIDHKFQGVIRGKRIATAECIGAAARTRAGYVPPKSTRESLLFRWRSRL